MDVRRAIELRKSIRKFTDKKITRDELELIVDAGRLAPSGKNSQNWHFIVITDQRVKDELGERIKAKHKTIFDEMQKIDEKKAERFAKFLKHFTLFSLNAAALIVVMGRNYYPSGYYEYELIGAEKSLMEELLYQKNPGMQSIGAAIENMTLQAIELGYGSCWLTSANYAAAEIEQYFKEKAYFFEEEYFLTAMLAIGEPQEPNNTPMKKPLDEVSTWI